VDLGGMFLWGDIRLRVPQFFVFGAGELSMSGSSGTEMRLA
jgi:hypothetical protein